MKNNAFLIKAFLLMGAVLITALPAKSLITAEPPGGSGTVNDTTENAFQHPFPDVSRDERRQFFVGNSFFRDVWVAAPSSTGGRDGLGPTFNAISCSSCHGLDGRGMGFDKNEQINLSLLFRLSFYDGQAFLPLANYGDQFNPLSIDGAEREGDVSVTFTKIPGAYPDGSTYELRSPSYIFSNLQFGEFEPNTRISPRVAPHLAGIGLLEAIDAKDILALADPKDADGDGISGRANWVMNVETKQEELGRFGWKANQPNLKQQNAGAFSGDLGISSSLFPQQGCPGSQKNCQNMPNGGEPEISDLILSRVTTYTQLLAVPNRRISDPEKIAKGEEKFITVGCAKCHHPSFITGNHELPLLSGQKIFPYTDMLLHDLGMELADHRPDGKANGREWKTPPLWGIGLFQTVSKHTNLLHDGRARNVEEAILWHGGEGNASREKFKALNKEERESLIAFVNSL